MPNTSLIEDSSKIFVLLPSKKNLITVTGISPAQAEKAKAHADRAGVSLATKDYREKEQTLYIRTVDEADASKMSAWLKANPLEVQ